MPRVALGEGLQGLPLHLAFLSFSSHTQGLTVTSATETRLRTACLTIFVGSALTPVPLHTLLGRGSGDSSCLQMAVGQHLLFQVLSPHRCVCRSHSTILLGGHCASASLRMLVQPWRQEALERPQEKQIRSPDFPEPKGFPLCCF